MLYNFEKGTIDLYDGFTLVLILPNTSVLGFNHVSDLNINKKGISFRGNYVPSKCEIVGLKYKNKDNDECEINVIYLGEDDKRIEVYYNPNIPNFDNLDISLKYISKKDCEFLPISESYFAAIMTELKEKGYIYDRNNIEIYKDVWKPTLLNDYYYVTTSGSINKTVYVEDDISDRMRLEIGNCFKTEEEAKEASEAFIKWFKAYRRQN